MGAEPLSGEKLRLAPEIHRRTDVKHPSGAAAGSFSGHSTDHTVTKAVAAPSDKRKFQEDNNFLSCDDSFLPSWTGDSDE